MIPYFVLTLYVGGFLGALSVMGADDSWCNGRQEMVLVAIVWPISAVVAVVEWNQRRELKREREQRKPGPRSREDAHG